MLRASLPLVGPGSNNDGNAFLIGSDPSPPFYVLTGFSGILTYPASFGPAVNLSATNLITGPLVVLAGDRIAIRLIVSSGSPADIALITRLGFHATTSYVPN